MTPLVSQRAARTPLVVVMFFWILANTALGQDQPPATQPAEQPAQKQPVVRPVTPPATHPATQAAQDRLATYMEMQEVAAKNGKSAQAEPPDQASSQPAGKEPDEPKPPAVERTRADIRQRALERREQREAAVREARRAAQSAEQAEPGRTSPPHPDERGLESVQEAVSDEPAVAEKPLSPPYGTTPLDMPRVSQSPTVEPVEKPEEPKVTPLPAAAEELPVEPPAEAEDGRSYFISFVDMPWEDVVQHYAKLVGKPIMGDIGVMPFGELTYESERRFTREEMRDELNFLLLEQGNFVVETIDYIYVVPLSELGKHIELDRVFPTIEAFHAANPRDLEICEVLIRIEGKPANDIRDMLSPSMPDHALPVVVGDTNNVKITGLGRDVRRFMSLLDIVETEKYDPRETRFIKVETNVREIERMLREMLGARQPTRRYDREKRQFVTEGGDSKILIIADERTKNLIVKATPAEIKEIEEIVKLIDEKPDIGEFKTTVIPVQYGSATDIARLLNEILQQEQGEQPRALTRAPTPTRPTRGRTPPQPSRQPTQGAAPEDIIVEDIYERAKKTVRIVADERTNNLVVYANEDGLKRVQEILEQIDQPVPANFQTFTLKYAKATDIQPTVDQIARGISGAGGRTRAALTIVADENLNALLVVAEREDMTRIEQIIKEFDVEVPEDQWHFVELRNITASEAARKITPFLDGGGAAGARRGGRGRGGPVYASATSQVIPLDEANTLIVICSDEEWKDVEQVLRIADEQALTNQPEIRFFDVASGSPESIANTITQLYSNYQHPILGRSRTFVDTLGQQIVVQGVKPALEEIESLVKSLDIAVEGNPLVILPLEYADATQVAQIAQGLLPPGSVGRGGRGGRGDGASLQAEPVINALIIQADTLTVDRIKAFATDMEQQVAAQKPERRYHTLKNASPRDVVNAINSLFGGSAGYRGSRAAVGTQVKTVIVGNQVVVDAPASKQLEVAALVEQLDALADQGITTLLVKMPGADVNSIARKLSSAFTEQVRQQGAVARFEPDTSTETILITVSRDLLEQTNQLLEKYKSVSQEIVNQTEFYQLKNAEATQVARWLQGELVTLMNRQLGRAAAQQVSVTPDTRTNRLVISAPQVAVTAAKTLLEQFDVPMVVPEEQPPPPVVTNTRKLPGLDVGNLSNQLNQVFRNRPRRPDGLGYSFGFDRMTEMVVYTVPKDAEKEVEELIDKFAAETEGMEVEQKIVEVKEADANYIANQLRGILSVRVTSRYGRDIASRITITPDTRLNKIFINAPRTVLEMAEALIAELDQPATSESQLRTIALQNTDASTINSILRTIFSEKIRARTLSISVEPLTNSLIVGAANEDFEDIQKWVEELDAKTVEAVTEPVIIELKNANPWEVYTVLNQTFVQLGAGKRPPPGKEIKFSIVAGRSIVVQAPPDKMKEIQDLAAKLDEIGRDELVVRKYVLKGLGTELNGLARDIQNAVNQRMPSRDQRISVTAVPAADTLIVSATERWLPEVEQAMEQFKDLYTPPQIETIALVNADANLIAQALGRVLQPKIRAGKIQISVEGTTNTLIVSAGDEDLAEIREWAAKFDEAIVGRVTTRFFELKYVDASQIVNQVRELVGAQLGSTRGNQVRDFTVSADVRTNRLIVYAPERIMPTVESVVMQLDIEVDETDVFTIEMQYADPGETRNMINDIWNRGVRGARSAAQEVYVTVSNNTLVVKAPPKKLEEIQKLLAKVDVSNPNQLQIKMYDLKVLNAQQVAAQVGIFLRSVGRVARRGEMQPGAFAEQTTNTLVVMAPGDQIPFIDTLISQIEAKIPDSAVTQTYVLKFARADQVQGHVDQMLRVKVAEKEGDVRGRQAQQRTVVMADPTTNRLFVFAPPEYQELAAGLIKMIDEEIETGEVINIIRLENADATQLAQTVTQTMQGSGPRGGRGAAPMKVIIVADAGSNSILLSGLPKDVAEVEKLIGDLEVTYDTIPELQYFTLEYALAYDVAEALRGIFPAGRNLSENVSITEDEYYNKLLVTANRRKMRQVETIVEQLDAMPEDKGGMLGDGRDYYLIPITRGDAYDIAYDVQDLLPSEDRGGPRIEADWYGEYIEVICRPSEYDRILKLVRQFEKKAKPEIVIRSRQFVGDPERMERLREYLLEREIPVSFEEPPAKAKVPESIIIDLHPEEEEVERTDKGREDVPATSMSGGASPFFGGVVLTALFQVQDPPADEPEIGAELDDEPEELDELPQREPATMQMLPDGRMIIRGARDAVDQLEEAIDLFEEDLSRGEVIRIFRFRHGDVNAASRILDMMFNTRQIRMPQQRQQPQQQQRGERGREGEEPDQRQSLMQQAMQMMGGGGQQGGGATGATGGTQIRIATDASHNYIIVKCDESLLPDITQLLRELDISPADVDLEVIQLKNLDASETANNIKQVLGIGGTRGGGAQPQQPRGGRNPQQQLMEMIQQQMVSIGEGSAKIESVEIVPNNITNSLLVSAPQDVMEIIKNVIDELEGLEGGDVTVIKHYKLIKGKVDDVLPLLQEIFSAAGGGGGPRGGSPADLGPVTISGDPRTNTLIFVAQAKDVETVNEQIEKLDIEGAIAEVEMYICKYGDAVGIAEVVEEMFATGGAPGGGRRGGRGAQPGGTNLEVRITAEPATNTILVFAPVEKRELILGQIEKLDLENRFEIREIPIVFAKPDKVADKLLQIFGGSGGSAAPTGRRGGSRQQAAATPGRIVVIPDQNAKKLLVRAPDEIFAKMQEITELLDQPSEQLLIQRFPLKHADASVVVESVRMALTELMQFKQQLGEEPLDIDAFTAMPDTRTNSVVVVGSEETFLFVQQVINEIDGDIPPDQEKQFRIFVLDRSDAQVVADAINAFAAGGGTSGGGGSSGRGGRRGGLMPGGGATGPTLDVQAIADPTTNSVMVYGRLENIEKVKDAVIAKLEDAMFASRGFETLHVNEAVPTQLITYIQPFLDETAAQTDTGRGGGVGARPGPRLIGNDNNKTIVVYGSERQIEEVRSLVERFDNKDTTINQFEIIEVPWGQDAYTLAAMVQELVNQSEQDWASRTGREPRLVTVNADEHSNAIVAFGDPAQTALVRTVVAQLQGISTPKPVTRVIELVNLSSAEAEQLIGDLQQRRGSSGGSTIRRGTTTPRRSTTPSQGSGTRRGGTRRRSWNWNPGPNAPRLSVAPASFASPFVGTKVLMPRLIGVLMTQDAAQAEPAQDQPAGEQPATPREEEQQQVLSSLSGQLRGEVVATPLDSRRIIVTGDAEDVEFIVQMLLMMEKSTPKPEIAVFTLESSKAAAIAPVLEETLRAMIEVRGGGDRVDNFSIVAEGRSNSLIVSASKPNMDLIEELIGKLDITTELDTQPKLVPLKHIRAAEAFELLQEPIKRLNDIREVPANAQATIQAVDRSNAILIVGTASDITEIEKLIQGIDIELPPEDDFSTAKVMVVDLTNAEAETLAETLTELIAMEKASSARGGARGGTDMPLLRKLIFSLADGTELPPIDLDKPIVVFPEKGRNALVLFSSEKNAVALLEIVKLFDSLPKGEEVEVKSFALRYANAEQVAELLENMFDQGRKALVRPSNIKSDDFDSGVMPPVPPGLAGRGLPYNVVINHDVRSNTIIVIGRQDAVLLAAGMVTELDRPSADLSLKPYVVQLRNIQATTLQEKLEELLEQRIDALGSDDNVARDSAIIQADDRSNTLIVLASPDVFTMVEDLAMQLDQAEPYSVVDSEFRRLTYADAAKLAGLLQELFNKKKDADQDVTEGGQKNILYVFADSRSNSLMLTGTRDYLVEANDLIDNLDQAFDPTVQFELRTVRLNSAANISQLLEDMIQASREGQEREMQGTPIHVAADPYSNSLLLAASAEDMLMLHRWIDVLDRPSEPGRITRIIPLRRGSAQELAQSAQELFGARASGADEDVTITHDETTNSVIAIGPPGVVKDIEDFIAVYNDVEGSGAIVRIFKLDQADAENAGELLRSILEGRGGSVGGGSRGSGTTEDFNQVMLIFQREHPEIGLETLKGLRKEVVVIDDLRTNSLVVTAPPETMPLMESLVTAIDVPPDAAKIRVFKLRNSDAEEMMTMLEELFETQGTTRGTGTEDQEYELSLGDLAAGGRQHLAFTVDTRTNSVIAAGTTGYLDLVDELILKLDSEPIELRKTFVYEPSNNTAMAIQQAISEFNDADRQVFDELQEEMSASERMRREIVAVSNEDTNRVIFSYDPRRESELLELVRDLDQPPPQVMIQVLIVEVTMDNSLELGVEFAFQDLQYTKAGTTDTTTFDFVGGTDIGAAGTGLGGFTFTITGADFNFLIRTLQNEGDLNVLSRPQIVAMDNQEAHIKITNDVPYTAGSTVTATGIVQTTVSRRPVGIELTVTPHINPDGFVRMEVLQTVSDITGSTVDVGQGVTSPIFLDREAETTVTVKDNETVVLGGLITTRDETREQKIPILGDIPLLGWLARNEVVDSSRTELLVILTPRVVRTVDDYRELSIEERDHTGVLPEAVLTSELMRGLQVAPQDLKPAAAEDLLGPFPSDEALESEQEDREPEDEYDPDIYGPLPPASAGEGQRDRGVGDPDSYDIPISWAGPNSTWADRRRQ